MDEDFTKEFLELTENQFLLKLFEDPTLTDFVNKFCFLPVFGQRISYIYSRGAFIFDPPLPSSVRKRPLALDVVAEWIYKNRWSKFIRSSLFDEFCLCQRLLQYPVWKHVSESSEDLIKEIYDSDDLKERVCYLQKYEVGRVSGMLRFRTCVSRTMDGEIIYMFWMDAQQLRRTSMEEDDKDTVQRKSNVLIRNIQKKYFTKTSSHCLPEFYLITSENNTDDYNGFEYIMSIQSKILWALQTYFLPVFLADQCRSFKDNEIKQARENARRDMLFRRHMDMEVHMLENLLRRCSMVHYHTAFENDRKFIPVTKFHYDEDEDNFLLHDISEAEMKIEKNSEVSPEDLIEKLVFDDTDKHPSSPEKTDTVEDRTKKDTIASKSSHGKLLNESEIMSLPNSNYSSCGYLADESSPESEKIQTQERSSILSYAAEEIANMMYDDRESTKSVAKLYPEFDASCTTKIKSTILFDAINEQTETETRNSTLDLKSRQSGSLELEPLFDHEIDFKTEINECSVTKISQSVSLGVQKSPNSNHPIKKTSSMSYKLPPIRERKVDFLTDSTSSESMSSLSFTSLKEKLEKSDSNESILSSDQSELGNGDAKPSSKMNTEEYWQNVFSEILLSDELSAHSFRAYLAADAHKHSQFTPREAEILKSAAGPEFTKVFGPPSVVENNKISEEQIVADNKRRQLLMVALNFWKDIEMLRRTYYSYQSKILRMKFVTLIRTYIRTEFISTPGNDNVAFLLNNLKGISFDSHHNFPPQLIALQLEIQKLLEEDWLKFASLDRADFREMLTEKSYDWKIYRPRNSFPNCLPEIRATPIRRLSRLAKEGKRVSENVNQELALHTFVDFKGFGEMKYRTSHSVHLLLMSANCAVKNCDTSGHFVNDYDCGIFADADSEDEGNMPPAEIQTFARLPEIEPKALASLSAKEYPIFGMNYQRYKSVRVIQRHIKPRKPIYLRPIRKYGQTITRPETRPKNLIEILRDDVHMMFFKKYMKMHKSETPVLFWKSVELLKQTEDARSRQQKAQTIMKKFFGALSGGGIMLQCEHDLIKEIANCEMVTTSMLVHAQTEVFRSLERNWARRYFSTFAEPENTKDDPMETDHNVRMFMMNNKLKRVWLIFSDFIRRAANFIRSMRCTELYRQFRLYLKHLIKTSPIKREDNFQEAGGDASSTAIFFTSTLRKDDTSDSYRFTVRKLFGRRITLDFLHNDLEFYIEVDRYVCLIENAERSIMEGGVFQKLDNDAIKEKAKTIMECFIESSIFPKLRINIEQDAADSIQENFKSSLFERGMFHDAMVTVFPMLLYYWKEFCLSGINYVSKKEQREERRKSVKEQRLKMMKKKLRQQKKKLNMPVSVNSSMASMKQPEQNLFEKQRPIPDYIKDLISKQIPYDKVKGLVWSDPPTLHFSLEHGLKLIVPPKRKSGANQKSETESDEDMFLSVWTRGNKEVNVIREGSDPKLYNIGKRDNPFVIKCDFVEEEKE